VSRMIVVEHLVYEYPGKRALDDVSFSIAPGTITALVGPNGSGKTTLLRCIAALDEPFSGRIIVHGIDLSEQPREVHRHLGYLSDFFGVYEDLTVRQCLSFAARVHGYSPQEIRARVQWVIDLLELGAYAEQPAGVLSRGWKQRLGIAQSVIHRPKLLLLDEPASGLDPEARIALSGILRQLQAEGMTLVVSSHILAELEDYCTDMLVLRDGKVLHHQAARAENLASTRRVSVVCLNAIEKAVACFASDSMVSALAQDGTQVTFDYTGDDARLAALLNTLIQDGVLISRFTADAPRLQDVYLSLGTDREDAHAPMA